MSLTYGLVVCGGKSTRMGKDKSLINYHGKPQRYYLYDLLQPQCDKVFISCNAAQAKTIPEDYNVIIDAPEYEEIGPMGALLSAFALHPEATFLVIGCDYPFIARVHMEALLKMKEDTAPAAAYYTITDNMYEPLIALYKPAIGSVLLNNFDKQDYSLRRVLEQVNSARIIPDSKELIKSVDTPAAYEKAINKIGNK